ncbi:MAG: aldehyde dehydrogenase family protein [Candidatus Magasanikbacteria bacterium]|nr:aldehyde dehydrogenase family protein [Candidatus Magasanikbacteria bacterium]
MEARTFSLTGPFKYSPAPESPKEALAWLSREGGFGHFIGGEFTNPGVDMLDAINPATGKVLARFTQGNAADVDAAYAAAAAAFPAWSALSGAARAEYLYAFERQILKFRRDFEVLEALDTGKPFRETRLADIPVTARHFGQQATYARLFERLFPGRKPGGVVGAVYAWNFPLMLLAWKVGAALAAGNTMVIKPGDTTPVTAMYFAGICRRVGLPPGVLNIVTGNRETGKLVVAHRTPWKISFTGSTAAGASIREATAGSGKRLTLELGGKSPMVVCEDADLDAVVEAVVRSILFNKGEVCCACSRLIVHEAVMPSLVERLKRRFARIRVGDPLDKSTDMGPLNSKAQFEKVTGMIHLAREEGAEVWQPDCTLPEAGFFVRPTLLMVDPSNSVARDEVFGPVLAVMTFTTTEDAIRLAGNTEYGLACSVWSNDTDKAHHVASRIKAGTRWVNCAEVFDGDLPFSGARRSGKGSEGGPEGMLDVTLEDYPPAKARGARSEEAGVSLADDSGLGVIDVTHRFLIGGALKRPDGGRSFEVLSPSGVYLGDVGEASRKDVRDAVTAASDAQASWALKGPDLRRKVLLFMREKIFLGRDRLIRELIQQTGCGMAEAREELTLTLSRLSYWASQAVNHAGRVGSLADPSFEATSSYEPVGVIGIRAPDAFPLLGLIGSLAPALARGNTVVLVSGKHPLTAMTLVEIAQTSDLPPGVLNILTASQPDAIALNLANHGNVDSVWCWGDGALATRVEKASARDMKRTWTELDASFDWAGPQGESLEFLRQATQVTSTFILKGA